jgi:hypothetical protein
LDLSSYFFRCLIFSQALLESLNVKTVTKVFDVSYNYALMIIKYSCGMPKETYFG